MSNLVQWIIEEKDVDSGKVNIYEYDNYNEAMDAFRSFGNDNGIIVSLQKRQKKLLTENI